MGGGVGIAAAADYAIAVEGADVKLSELAVGIGPFVVGPAVERKIGTAGFAHLSIDATMWRNSDWARRKGLFAELHSSITDMDESIARLSNTLAHSSPQAMHELKKVLWKGTDHWDQLLIERAKISGELVLSSFTRNAIQEFKAKAKKINLLKQIENKMGVAKISETPILFFNRDHVLFQVLHSNNS